MKFDINGKCKNRSNTFSVFGCKGGKEERRGGREGKEMKKEYASLVHFYIFGKSGGREKKIKENI